MTRTLLLAISFFGATPAFADTVHCESPDRSAVIDIDVEFDKHRDTGTVNRVRAETELGVALSTVAGETEWGPDTLAFGDVAYDRIQAGLESPNTGPTTFRLDIVRAADFQPGEEAEVGVVVAGVAYIAGIGTVTLTCTGW
jgi:hypothetical protein